MLLGESAAALSQKCLRPALLRGVVGESSDPSRARSSQDRSPSSARGKTAAIRTKGKLAAWGEAVCLLWVAWFTGWDALLLYRYSTGTWDAPDISACLLAPNHPKAGVSARKAPPRPGPPLGARRIEVACPIRALQNTLNVHYMRCARKMLHMILNLNMARRSLSGDVCLCADGLHGCREYRLATFPSATQRLCKRKFCARGHSRGSWRPSNDQRWLG
eukprot:238025-Pleurochrysis_carterae.AAC.4